MKNINECSLNQLVELTLSALHQPSIENKAMLCQAIRVYLNNDRLDICERFKGTVAINLLVEDIEVQLRSIEDVIHQAA